jgi:hypothetical protein
MTNRPEAVLFSESNALQAIAGIVLIGGGIATGAIIANPDFNHHDDLEERVNNINTSIVGLQHAQAIVTGGDAKVELSNEITKEKTQATTLAAVAKHYHHAGLNESLYPTGGGFIAAAIAIAVLKQRARTHQNNRAAALEILSTEMLL